MKHLHLFLQDLIKSKKCTEGGLNYSQHYCDVYIRIRLSYQVIYQGLVSQPTIKYCNNLENGVHSSGLKFLLVEPSF